jgi:hypothetical protein
MDRNSFDRLALLLGAARSRREALRVLAAGAAMAVTFRAPRPASAAICPERAPRPGYTPTINGCGPDGWDWVVPDSWKKARFTRACSNHDACYATCNSKKARCEDAFLDDLKKACRAAYPSTGTPRQRNLAVRCRDRAYQYYTAVSEYGQSAWEAAQAEACICCNEGNRGPKCGNTCCKKNQRCDNGRCVDGGCLSGHFPCGKTACCRNDMICCGDALSNCVHDRSNCPA